MRPPIKSIDRKEDQGPSFGEQGTSSHQEQDKSHKKVKSSGSEQK